MSSGMDDGAEMERVERLIDELQACDSDFGRAHAIIKLRDMLGHYLDIRRGTLAKMALGEQQPVEYQAAKVVLRDSAKKLADGLRRVAAYLDEKL